MLLQTKCFRHVLNRLAERWRKLRNITQVSRKLLLQVIMLCSAMSRYRPEKNWASGDLALRLGERHSDSWNQTLPSSVASEYCGQGFLPQRITHKALEMTLRKGLFGSRYQRFQCLATGSVAFGLDLYWSGRCGPT